MLPLLLAMAAAGPALDTGTQHEMVRLGWDSRAKACSAQVHGGEVGDPSTDAGQDALIEALPDPAKMVHLLGTMDVPFVCVAGARDALQKSGRRFRIGLTAEPPRAAP